MNRTAKKRQLQREAEDIIARSKAEGRALTSDEQLQCDRKIAEMKAISEEIDREREHHDDGVLVWDGARGADGFVPSSHSLPAAKQSGPRYCQMFPNVPISSDGFRSFDEFLRTWHSAKLQFDPRLRAAQNEGVPSAGGFLVPTEYAQMILDQALESEIVRPRAQIWPMGSDTRKVPGVDNFDHSANIYGFTSAWTAELGAGSTKDMKFRMIELHAQKLMLLGQASNELVADAIGGFGSVYGAKMSAAASWFLDFAFLNGDGAGKPKGVLTDPALIVVNKESTQPAGSLVYENVTNMLARLHPSCFANAIWVCNSTALPQLLRMMLVVKNVAGTENVGGSATPVFSQAADGTFRLLTRPLVFTEKLPQLGTQGDIVLADFSQYAIGMRREIALEQSIHPGFTSDSTFFRIVTRVDGQGTWKSAVTPKNGVSQSWCVTLQAR